jgi:hypothetical protein
MEGRILSSVRKTTLYFEKAGEQNTQTLLKFVKNYVEKEDIKDIVVASTTGHTGAEAANVFKGRNLVVVAHSYGFKEPGKNELQTAHQKRICAKGGKIFAGTHALSSVERAIRSNFGTIQPLELIANVLRRLGDGTKVCVEITLMAADAGLIPVDRDIVAIGGTGKGADTALRIRPANSAKFFDLKIMEVIAKPLNF